MFPKNFSYIRVYYQYIICNMLNFDNSFATFLILNSVGKPSLILSKEVIISTQSYKLFIFTDKISGMHNTIIVKRAL